MKLKQLYPTFLLIGLLILIGLGVYLWTDSDVMWSGYIAMMFFYALIFFLGTYAAQKRESNNATDVLLAGRNIPLWMAIFTMSATWIGGGYINGSAEFAAADGYGLMWVQAPWGYAMSLIIGGLLFARKMRRYQFKTMLDPLEQRYGKRMAALLFIPALMGELFWTAAILVALGTTFGAVLDLDFTTSIILSAIIAIAYTSVGGLWAVAMTDVIQMCLLVFGLLLILPFAFDAVGGWDVAWANYYKNQGDLASFIPSKKALGNYYWQWWDYAFLLMFGGIAWQVYFQRVLSARDEKTAMWLSVGAGVVCLLVAIPAVLVGVVENSVDSWVALGAQQELVNANDFKLTLPYVVRYLTPPIVATLGLGAIAAAVMSSIDSSILSVSSMASWNIYRPLVNPNLSPSALSKVMKSCIWIVGITATLIALQVDSIYVLWYLCSDFVYCLLFPPLVCALFDKKANSYGAFAGFIIAFILRFGGGESAIGLPVTLPYPMIEGDICLFPFRTLAMVSGLLSIMVVSRLTQGMERARKLVEE